MTTNEKPHTNRKLRRSTIRCFDDNFTIFDQRGRQELNKSRFKKTRSAEGLRKSRGRKARKDFFRCSQRLGSFLNDCACTTG